MARSNTDKMKAIVGIQFEGIEAEIAKLQKQMKTLGNAIPEGAKGGFDKVEKQVKRLKDELKKAGDEDTFKDLQVSMGRVAAEAQKIGTVLSSSQAKRGQLLDAGKTDRATAALAKYRDMMRQTAQGTQRTSLASQNMLRIIQDSPFGMLGMANNIQMLGEDISRGLAKGQSAAETLKGAFKSLIAGPMAIAAVIAIGTLIIQKWDKIIEVGTKLSETLDGVTKSQREFNAAVRDFQASENLQKWVDSLSNDDARTARDTLTKMRDELVRLNPELAKLDVAKIKKQGGAIEFFMKALGQGGGTGLGAVVAGGKSSEAIQQFMAMQDELDRLNKKIQEDVREDGRDHARGILTDQEKEAEKLAKKKKEEADKAAIALIQAKMDQAKIAEEFREIDRKADEEREKERLKAIEEAARKEVAARRVAAQSMRKALQDISRRIAVGDIAAGAIGVGAFESAGVGASRKEIEDKMRLESMFEKARLDEKISLRMDGIEELEEKMSRATGDELNRAKTDHQKLLEEIKSFEKQHEQISIETAEKIQKFKHESRMKDLQSLQQIGQSIGQTFGNMATVMGEQTEKGFKQHKGALKLAAYADAIAAGIAVYRNVAQAGTANPLVMIGAAAAMAATITGLMAKIRQIDNPGGAGGGAAITGGHYTALTTQTAGVRAAAFQSGQDRLSSTTTAGHAAAADRASSDLRMLGENLKNQKVVIDQSTIAEVARVGGRNNEKLVQTSE